jgi:hypothetical protein
MDAKEIGLAAKDVIFGIGAAVAGAEGGPAAAQGVTKAGAGLDRILAMVLPDDKKASRTTTAPPAETEPLSGDAKLTADHLRELGWSQAQIEQILRGPEPPARVAETQKHLGEKTAPPEAPEPKGGHTDHIITIDPRRINKG